MLSLPVRSSWEEEISFLKESFLSFVRWALVCPPPLKKENVSPPVDEVFNEERRLFNATEDYITVGLTFLAAFSLLYVVDLLVQLIYGLFSKKEPEPCGQPGSSESAFSLVSESSSALSLNKTTSYTMTRLAAGGISDEFDDQFEDNEVVIFGGEEEPKGTVILGSRSPVVFSWLGENKEVSVTGSFFGHNFSLPLEGSICRMTLPPGEHQYEFVMED